VRDTTETPHGYGRGACKVLKVDEGSGWRTSLARGRNCTAGCATETASRDEVDFQHGRNSPVKEAHERNWRKPQADNRGRDEEAFNCGSVHSRYRKGNVSIGESSGVNINPVVGGHRRVLPEHARDTNWARARRSDHAGRTCYQERAGKTKCTICNRGGE